MENTLFSKRAGLIVCVTSAFFVGIILYILMQQIEMIEQTLPVSTLSGHKIVCETEACSLSYTKLLIESDVLKARYTAVQSSMSSRLMIFVSAEIVALILAVLGGVLIFDRVRSNEEGLTLSKDDRSDGVNSEKPDILGDNTPALHIQPVSPRDLARLKFATGFQVALSTSFPGVLLCAFSVFIVVTALSIATSKDSKISIADEPFFAKQPYVSLPKGTAQLFTPKPLPKKDDVE